MPGRCILSEGSLVLLGRGELEAPQAVTSQSTPLSVSILTTCFFSFLIYRNLKHSCIYFHFYLKGGQSLNTHSRQGCARLRPGTWNLFSISDEGGGDPRPLAITYCLLSGPDQEAGVGSGARSRDSNPRTPCGTGAAQVGSWLQCPEPAL